MAQDKIVKLACKDCGRINYNTRKNKRKIERKFEFNKHCKWCRQHTVHKERKK